MIARRWRVEIHDLPPLASPWTLVLSGFWTKRAATREAEKLRLVCEHAARGEPVKVRFDVKGVHEERGSTGRD